MIFDKIEKRSVTTDNNYTFSSLFEQGYDVDSKKEITYFSCLDILSKSVAKCPLILKKETEKGEVVDKNHYLYELLRLRPNSNMSAIDCMRAFVSLAIVKGISGIYVNRDDRGKIKGLYPVIISNITIDNVGLIKSNKNNKVLYDFHTPCDNNTYSCFEKDIILLKGYSEDGINTESLNNTLRQNLDTSVRSQDYLNKLFKNGLTNKVVIQLTSDIKEDKELRKQQDKFNRLYYGDGKTFIIPAGFNVSTLDLKLADAQFEQLRRLSKEEIAGAMGVPLSKLGFVKENAKSEEQDNLKFYTDTLLVYFEQIEQEMDYKLLTETERKQGYKIRFNANVMLRTDAETQANIINSYVRNGIYSLNTAKEILGIEKLDNDVTTFPSGQITLEALLNGEASWQKNNGKNNNSTGEGVE